MPTMTKTPTPANKLQKRVPLWKGPATDGITFSLLSKFLVCRDRFHKRVVEGVVEDEGFKHAMEYGSLWHAAEEAFCGGKPWLPAMTKYFNHLIGMYPASETLIRKWFNICKLEFPLYIEFWEKHQDEKGRQPLLEEVAFKVPYTLPSGRTVVLRGKWDAVMLLSAPTKKEPLLFRTWQEHWPKAKFGITNQENKTKGEIDEIGILGTLGSNLQTMIYHLALREELKVWQDAPAGAHIPPVVQKMVDAFLCGHPITGVLYNVIRRPLSDRYCKKQKVAETEKVFLDRAVTKEIQADPKHYFMRWRVLLTPQDIERFQTHIFNPILEQLCDWWEWISVDPFDPWRPRKAHEFKPWGAHEADCDIPNHIHWQAPWGVYDSLAGGFRGDYFEFLTTGREYGLRRIKTLYPELETP